MVPLGIQKSYEDEDTSTFPCIIGLLDTGASLTAGYSHYVLGIAEQFSSLVKSIQCANEDTGYTHIQISGVVSEHSSGISKEDRQRLSIKFPAILTFYMPCMTKVEHATTTFSIAIGNNVAVNLLIGMSFIRNAGMVIDLVDNVVESRTSIASRLLLLPLSQLTPFFMRNIWNVIKLLV